MAPRDEAQLQRLLKRTLTLAGNRVALPVPSSATTLVATLTPDEFDAGYGVCATPNWGTTLWVTGKGTTQFTLHFGTAAPADATVDVLTFREVL